MTEYKRRIVLYSNDMELPADPDDDELLPVIRGNGPREGIQVGWGRIRREGDEMVLEFDAEAKREAIAAPWKTVDGHPRRSPDEPAG